MQTSDAGREHGARRAAPRARRRSKLLRRPEADDAVSALVEHPDEVEAGALEASSSVLRRHGCARRGRRRSRAARRARGVFRRGRARRPESEPRAQSAQARRGARFAASRRRERARLPSPHCRPPLVEHPRDRAAASSGSAPCLARTSRSRRRARGAAPSLSDARARQRGTAPRAPQLRCRFQSAQLSPPATGAARRGRRPSASPARRGRPRRLGAGATRGLQQMLANARRSAAGAVLAERRDAGVAPAFCCVRLRAVGVDARSRRAYSTRLTTAGGSSPRELLALGSASSRTCAAAPSRGRGDGRARAQTRRRHVSPRDAARSPPGGARGGSLGGAPPTAAAARRGDRDARRSRARARRARTTRRRRRRNGARRFDGKRQARRGARRARRVVRGPRGTLTPVNDRWHRARRGVQSRDRRPTSCVSGRARDADRGECRPTRRRAVPSTSRGGTGRAREGRTGGGGPPLSLSPCAAASKPRAPPDWRGAREPPRRRPRLRGIAGAPGARECCARRRDARASRRRASPERQRPAGDACAARPRAPLRGSGPALVERDRHAGLHAAHPGRTRPSGAGAADGAAPRAAPPSAAGREAPRHVAAGRSLVTRTPGSAATAGSRCPPVRAGAAVVRLATRRPRPEDGACRHASRSHVVRRRADAAPRRRRRARAAHP